MRTPASPALRRIGAGVAAAALATTTAIALAGPAAAATATVDDVTLTWTMNDETGGGAYFGGCNFLSAGAAGNTGSSRLWAESDGFYKASEGNVAIEKLAADGYTTPSWGTKCQNAAGATVSPQAGSTTGNRVVLSAGTGTVDLEAGTASVAWDGDFTVVFYGGLTYWTISDPVLEVTAGGDGRLTGTASGYGTSMEDMSQWVALEPEHIVLADLSGVQLGEDGLSVTPDYLGVEVAGEGISQNRTAATWGSFPQSFVDFNVKTGQAAYWFSSGGAADPKKPAKPLAVAWEVTPAEEPGEPEPEEPVVTDGDVPVVVEVPETEPEPEPGALSWTINGTSAVSLGQATAGEAGFSATGVLHPISVEDTRTNGAGWSLSGSASAFASGANTFASSALGWTPSATGSATGLQAGPAVTAGNGAGLSTQQTLASANGAGTAQVSTGLTLLAPAGTPAGAYTSTLTLTALG